MRNSVGKFFSGVGRRVLVSVLGRHVTSREFVHLVEGFLGTKCVRS